MLKLINLINHINILYYEEQIPTKDIARKFNISVDQVRNYRTKKEKYLCLSLDNAVKDKPFEYMEDLVAYIKQRLSEKLPLYRSLAYSYIIDKYNISITKNAFRNYFSIAYKYAKNEQRLYLPLLHRPGEAELDFGQCSCFLKNTLSSITFMAISFPYSNYCFCQLLETKDTISLLKGLDTMFKYLGIYPAKLRCDNDVAIISQDTTLPLIESYCKDKNIKLNFCNIKKPHEKVHVENAIRKIRRNILTPPPKISSLIEYNKLLLEKCWGLNNIRDYHLFDSDKISSIDYDKKARYIAKIDIKADCYGQIAFDNSVYYISNTAKYKKITLAFSNASTTVIINGKEYPVDNHLTKPTDIKAYLCLLKSNLAQLHHTVLYNQVNKNQQKKLLFMSLKDRSIFIDTLISNSSFCSNLKDLILIASRLLK